VGQDRAAGDSQGGDGGVVAGQVTEPVGVHDAVAAGRNVQQVGVVAGRQGSEEPDPGGLELLMVGRRVLPGVVDHGQRLNAVDQQSVAGDQFVQHGGELGDVGAVAGVGMRDDRDTTVTGHDQRQTDQPQIGNSR
jgi:hypothetical protein